MTKAGIRTDSNLLALPAGLPRPEDDGGARHLLGSAVPHVRLRSTGGEAIDVGEVARGLSVFFLYPATIAPPAVIPGEWSEIPGARGCTIQNAGFREAYPALSARGARVFGVSGQGQVDPDRGLAEQLELKERLRLPFDLLNDSRFELADALRLPTFVASLREPTVEFEGRRATFPLQGRRLLKRLTFIAEQGRIQRVFYPVFPPDRNAEEVLRSLGPRGPSGAR
jgi:peroxiredoxin